MINLLQNKLTLSAMLDMGVLGSVLQKMGCPPQNNVSDQGVTVLKSLFFFFFVYLLCRQDRAGKKREVKSRDRRDKEDNLPKIAPSFCEGGLLRT